MTAPASYLGWKIDFRHPTGEAAYVHPGSVQWRVFKNPIALGIGGVAAVLLEFADARIRSGVWDHSTYKSDPIGRSKRTGAHSRQRRRNRSFESYRGGYAISVVVEGHTERRTLDKPMRRASGLDPRF